jgi:predicted component of type VI protein secretion system
VAAQIAQSREELHKLAESLAAKMGGAAPGLGSMRQAVEDCHTLMQQIVARQRPASLPPDAAGAGTPGVQARAGAGPTVVTSRADAYRLLEQAAAVLREIEPHSPIPYLVQRAIRLGAMPFPQLIRELIREANVVAELNRELGIQEPPPPA